MKRSTVLAALALAGLLGAVSGAAAATAEGPRLPRFPDTALADQEGRPIHFYSDLVRGRVVAINFIFTHCTTICPPLGANFAKLRKLLGARAGHEVELISVSVDPANDTPARLKAWAEKFGHGPGWTLVTGDRDEVATLLKALGVYSPDPGSHSPLVLLGNDATGRWTRAHGLLPPTQLAEMLRGLEADR